MTKPCILIMAGGTGGHVIPALTVARYLREKGWDIHWLGTKAGLEQDLVPKAEIPLHHIKVQGLRRKGLLAWFLAPAQLLRALLQSLKVIHKLRPDAVLGMGGFVAGPGGVAAWLLRRPLVIHEQNAIAGTTNRCLAALANRVLEAFPNSFTKKSKAICTGNPIRGSLINLPTPKERFRDRQGNLKLLILGGSRGAIALNQLCPKAIAAMPLEKRPEVRHQAGGGQELTTRESYEASHVAAKVEPFIEDMAEAYQWADLVLCRAGALTVSELAAVGIGSLLIPFPFAVDDHQTYNGKFLEQVGAALLIPQSSLTAEKLANILLELSGNRERLLKMAEAAWAMARRNALIEVATFCEEFQNHGFKKS